MYLLLYFFAEKYAKFDEPQIVIRCQLVTRQLY